MTLTLPDWLSIFESEYLAEFIPSGGSTVKIAVSEAGTQQTVLDSLVASTQRRGFLTVRLDAAETKLQFVEQVFFAVSRQTDWVALADRWLRAQLAAAGIALGPDQALSDLETVARGAGTSAHELTGEVRRLIVNGLLKDYRLAREFRTAMAMLCHAAINPGNVSPGDADELVRWLRGERVSLKALKKLQIFSAIRRHNARHLLSSLSLWIQLNGYQGLVVAADGEAIWKPSPMDARGPVLRYSRNACLDFFEVLRQFIDETDELHHFLLVVAVPPDFWTDPKKSVAQYAALQMRVADEVRDRNQSNPLGAAVRLEIPLEVGL